MVTRVTAPILDDEVLRLGSVTYSFTATGVEDVLSSQYDWIRKAFIKISKDSIATHLGNDPTKYKVTVNGVADRKIEEVQLPKESTKDVIFASNSQSVEALRKAYEAAVGFLGYNPSGNIGGETARMSALWRDKGRAAAYPSQQTGAQRYGDGMTVLVNGQEVFKPNWDTIKPTDNIQIYSKARHASVLEVIHRGGLLAAAYGAAKKASPEVAVAFLYRKAIDKKGGFGKLEQTEITRRRTMGEDKQAGTPFNPTAIAVLELGLRATSNIYEGFENPGVNIRKGGKRTTLKTRGYIKKGRKK